MCVCVWGGGGRGVHTLASGSLLIGRAKKYNPKQNEAQSACAESTNKGVN